MNDRHLTCAVAVAELEDEVIGLRKRTQELEAQLVRAPKGRAKKSPPLATIQDLHLELIRRSTFNSFDGQRVHRDLLAHRACWRAVLMDRPRPTVRFGLIKLRDLHDDYWNVDTLFVLATDAEAAQTLADFESAWKADLVVVHAERATRDALGTGESVTERLVTFWWD